MVSALKDKREALASVPLSLRQARKDKLSPNKSRIVVRISRANVEVEKALCTFEIELSLHPFGIGQKFER